jgi:hypothetical protein
MARYTTLPVYYFALSGLDFQVHFINRGLRYATPTVIYISPFQGLT